MNERVPVKHLARKPITNPCVFACYKGNHAFWVGDHDFMDFIFDYAFLLRVMIFLVLYSTI